MPHTPQFHALVQSAIADGLVARRHRLNPKLAIVTSPKHPRLRYLGDTHDVHLLDPSKGRDLPPPSARLLPGRQRQTSLPPTHQPEQDIPC